MIYNLKNRHQAFLLLLCFIFLSYLFLAPHLFEIEYRFLHSNALSGSNIEKNIPMDSEREYSYITTLRYKNDILTEGTFSFNQFNNEGEDRQLIFRGFYMIAALVAGYSLLLYYRRNYVKPTYRHIPLLSISKGGHAPPCTI